MLHKRLIPDSGGAGQHRGGPGQEIAVRCTAKQPVMLTIRPDLMKYPALGLNQGGLGMPGDVLLNGVKVERFTPIAWHPGDEIVLRVPGGGGFGDPGGRDPERIREDVLLGLVSLQAAAETYGLRIDATPEEVSLEAIRRYARPDDAD